MASSMSCFRRAVLCLRLGCVSRFGIAGLYTFVRKRFRGFTTRPFEPCYTIPTRNMSTIERYDIECSGITLNSETGKSGWSSTVTGFGETLMAVGMGQRVCKGCLHRRRSYTGGTSRHFGRTASEGSNLDFEVKDPRASNGSECPDGKPLQLRGATLTLEQAKRERREPPTH
jgi:hypothetical protein